MAWAGGGHPGMTGRGPGSGTSGMAGVSGMGPGPAGATGIGGSASGLGGHPGLAGGGAGQHGGVGVGATGGGFSGGFGAANPGLGIGTGFGGMNGGFGGGVGHPGMVGNAAGDRGIAGPLGGRGATGGTFGGGFGSSYSGRYGGFGSLSGLANALSGGHLFGEPEGPFGPGGTPIGPRPSKDQSRIAPSDDAQNPYAGMFGPAQDRQIGPERGISEHAVRGVGFAPTQDPGPRGMPAPGLPARDVGFRHSNPAPAPVGPRHSSPAPTPVSQDRPFNVRDDFGPIADTVFGGLRRANDMMSGMNARHGFQRGRVGGVGGGPRAGDRAQRLGQLLFDRGK